MKGAPFVILDDYFVKADLLASLQHQLNTCDIRIRLSPNGGHIEIPQGNPFLQRLFSKSNHLTHTATPWMRTPDVRITYSRWLYYTHAAIIVSLMSKYIAGLGAGPLVYTLGTLGNLCMALVVSFHVGFYLSLNWRPRWFEKTVVFHSPFAWAAIWLLIMQGEDNATMAVGRQQQYRSGAVGGRDLWVVGALDRRIGPLGMLLMHVFVWYTRRTVIGVTVFERKTRASLAAHWTHRVCSVLAPLPILLAWKWYPLVSACCDLYGYSGARQIFSLFSGNGLVGEWAAERSMIAWRKVLGAMILGGGSHVLWYSFISYAYHMVVWRVYLREGLAVWVVRGRAMCTKLV
ncbi:hypothetical protein BX661DRAFT_181372 [Kickxella alabastrina]|uniref:uncharacterized protein n=1 Tax=Kickxella alabastrina TaxID=61397 RepID=UPI00221ECAE3|nr:uncharacterized protein BX661DRAFT_181372 [Kickxella alabastrina]KAI7829097.1 hypothetical protein BX661DRAFT_181372 [Kickxella alabastrina]